MIDLSIIIPVFNESKKIGNDIHCASNFLETYHLKGEIIIVDDGSSDHSGDIAEKAVVPPGTQKRIIRHSPNRGKGYAVRVGLTQAKGNFAMFADSGHCIPFHYVLKGMEMINAGLCDIAHGSRKLTDSKVIRPASANRRILSFLYRELTVLLLGIPPLLTDTQCGFKLYRGIVARELYAECLSSGFSFDTEIILRALQKNYKIQEFPVEWSRDPDTRVLPFKITWRVLAEFFAIRNNVSDKSS